MKYIDAEKLRAEIERRLIGYDPDYTSAGSELKKLLSFITSLQQEQPEADGDDGKFVKILVRKEFAEQFQRLGDEIQAGQSSFFAAINPQEQPEVELEKEMDKYYSRWMQGASDEGCFNEDCQLISIYDCRRIALHFYKLGLNARKEK